MNFAERRTKQALEAKKLQILNDLKYYDERIKELRNKPKQIVEDCYSSDDSDFDLTKMIDLGPSLPALKRDQKRLRTCLQATQELTSVEVLQSETNFLVDDPVVDGEKVTEIGDWWEIVAECRIDLVPFVINFMVHRSSRKFGPVHYRNLRVTPVKKVNENELNSALATVNKPADAIEIIKQYAEEHRSRRNSLARLADIFAGGLKMAAMPEGGYTLQCLDVLEILWIIKYSRSRVRFQHAMKFDIDHLGESYIAVIKNAYQQLNNATTTEKRTALIEKIIRTCLEATGRTDFGESTTDQSDQEVIDKRIQKPNQMEAFNRKDSEIMAPPKSLPKKTKLKGKENKDRNAEAVETGNDEVPVKKPKKDSTVDVNLKTLDANKNKDAVQKKVAVETKKISSADKEVAKKVVSESQSKVKEIVPEKKNKNISPVNDKTDLNKENNQTEKPAIESKNKQAVQEKNKKKVSPVNKRNNQNKENVQSKKLTSESESKVTQNVSEKNNKNIRPSNEKPKQNKENDQVEKPVSDNVKNKETVPEKSKKKIVPVIDKSKTSKDNIKTTDKNQKSAPVNINKDTQNVPANNKKKNTTATDKPTKNSAEKNSKPKEIVTSNKPQQNIDAKAPSEEKNKNAPKKDSEITSKEKTVKNVAKPVSKIPKFKPSSTKDSENDSKASSTGTISKIPKKDNNKQKLPQRIMSPRSRNLLAAKNIPTDNNKQKLPQKVVSSTKVTKNTPTEDNKAVENQRTSAQKRKLSIVDRVTALESKRKSMASLQTMKTKNLNSVTKNKLPK